MGKRAPCNILNSIKKIILIAFCLAIAILALFILTSRIGGAPSIAGYRIYAVLSGSMSPAFKTGSIVVTEPVHPADVRAGDIITFSSGNNSGVYTTHRVISVKRGTRMEFTTKGDANNIPDPLPVYGENIAGRLVFSIPYAGYAIYYARTKLGLILLVILPGTAFVCAEFIKLLNQLQAKKANKIRNS